MRDAKLRGFDDPGVDVFGRAVGRTGNGIEPAPDVVLASLLLVSPETHDMFFHARRIRPLGCPDGTSSFVVQIAIDADDLLLTGFDPFLEGQRGFSDHGLDQAGFGSPEGKAAGADVAKFATGGADMIIFDTKEV